MFPLRFISDVAYSGRANFVKNSGLPCTQRATSNFKNLFFGEFSSWRKHSRPGFRSSFLIHILHVVLRSSKRKMVGINAPRVIARMHNKKSLWDPLFIMDLPRKAMGITSRPSRTTKNSINPVSSAKPFKAFMKWNESYLIPKLIFSHVMGLSKSWG